MSSLSIARGRPRLILLLSAVILISFAALLPTQQGTLKHITGSLRLPKFIGGSSFSSDLDSSSPYPSSTDNTRPTTAAGQGKANAVIFMLVPPSRMHQTLVTLRNVEDRFNKRLKYPYILFVVEGEEHLISETDRQKADHITEGRLSFATVPKYMWDPPSWADQSKIDNGLETIGFSVGYRSMCRFYSAFFWKHPALQGYEWFWRLDTDIEFHCDVPYDPVQHIADAGGLYGFVQLAMDVDWVQPHLAPNVSQWMGKNRALIDKFSGGLPLPPSSRASHAALPKQNTSEKVNIEFVWGAGEGLQKALNGEASNDDWTHKCMYNNFEISHRSLWESELYTSLADYLEEAGGFFYERWSDSPIHSFGAAMLLRKEQVVQLLDLGYQHQGWEYECPAESPLCTCERDPRFDGWSHNGEGWYQS